MTTKPHKHAAVIHAYADGAAVQMLAANGAWITPAFPDFDPEREYRIKPEPPKYPQTRMTEKERWDSITAAGIGLFNIGTSREKGADRLEHSPGDVTAAIANAAIARAIEDGDVVTLDEHNAAFAKAMYDGRDGTLSKVAHAFAEAMALESARRTPGPGGYPISDDETREITRKERMRIRKELAQIIIAVLKEQDAAPKPDMVPTAMLEKVAEGVRAELVAQVARYSTGCSTYINGEIDIAAIITSVKEAS